IPRLAAGRGRKSTVAMTMPFPQLIDSFCQTAKSGQLHELACLTVSQTAKSGQLHELACLTASLTAKGRQLPKLARVAACRAVKKVG
ncbi:hypothetical protein ACFFT4_26730, partial [Cohnella cellulosilytica]